MHMVLVVVRRVLSLIGVALVTGDAGPGGSGRGGHSSGQLGLAEDVDGVGLSQADGASAQQRANLVESWDMAVEDTETASRWFRDTMLASIGSKARGDN